MVKVLLFDFGRTLLFPKDKMYKGGLNELHNSLSIDHNYVFTEHFQLNQELLDYLVKIKDKFELYIFTTETIQDDPAVKPYIDKVFNGVYTAKSIGLNKGEPQAYEWIAKKHFLNPLEILFIDNREENIAAANQADVKTFHYTDNASLIAELNKLQK